MRRRVPPVRATPGGRAAAEPKGDDFRPLGVFAPAREGETNASNIFQLGVNTDGVVRGNYYSALTDSAEPVYGAADRKTPRVARTVGDRKFPVYEAGVANLTRDEATVLVHFGPDNPQQLPLVRVRQPEDGRPPNGR